MGLFQEQCRRPGPGRLPSRTLKAGDGPRSEEIRALGCAQRHLDHWGSSHPVGPRSPGQRVKEGWQRPDHGRDGVPGVGWDKITNQGIRWSRPDAEALG